MKCRCSYNQGAAFCTKAPMAAEYDEFERRLRERLRTISEEIELAKEQGRESMKDATDHVGRQLAAQQIKSRPPPPTGPPATLPLTRRALQ